MRRHTRHLSTLLLVAVAALALAGCKVTGDDIEYWKGTVKGPGKIIAVILSDRYPMELRTQGALALVEMERTDVDGVAELQRTVQRLQSQDAVTCQQLVDAMTPGLESLMSAADQAQQEGQGAAPQSVRAKDAAYLLIPHASAQMRGRLVAAVVGWYVVDFNGRALSGNYSAEQVVRSVGASAASLLVDAMNARMPQQALVKIAELVSQIGDEETKGRAGERLVAIETEMEGDSYLDWLKGEIRAAMEASGTAVDERRIEAVSALNRENFINGGALPAMKHLAAVPAVAARLLTMAEAVPPEGTPPALVDRATERRKTALQALEGNATRDHLSRLMALALDEAAPIAVRDYAFDRVGDMRERSVIPQLWPLVQSGDNDPLKKRLRWRAGELVLSLGGESTVDEFLGKLPSGRDVQFEPEELAGYATRMSQMTTPPLDSMRRQLRSPQWYIRVIALDFLERRGEASDEAAMQRLTSDAAPVVGEGWGRRDPAIPNVGKVAEAAVAAMRERLAQPAAAPTDGGAEAPAAGGN